MLEFREAEIKQKIAKLEAQTEQIKAETQAKYFQDDLEPDPDSSNPMDIMAMAFMNKMMGGGNAPDPGTNNYGSSPSNSKIDLTEGEIEAIVKQLPKKQIKQIQKLPDSVISKWIQGQYPMISDSSIMLAIGVLKKKDLKVRR